MPKKYILFCFLLFVFLAAGLFFLSGDARIFFNKFVNIPGKTIVTDNGKMLPGDKASEQYAYTDSEVAAAPEEKLKLLNAHSHPQEGEDWTIAFLTKGSGDLEITPQDQNSINDIDFVFLQCGDQKMEPQILGGDTISYRGWSCDGKEAKIVHKVNVARPHQLKFSFADYYSFAYNSPDSISETFLGTSMINSNSISSVCNAFVTSSNTLYATSLATAASSTCAIKTDGTVWCWGGNNSGQLGQSNTLARSLYPVRTKDFSGFDYITGASQISAGGANYCVVKTDNTVWCWGDNSYGQLGNGNTTNQYYPVQVKTNSSTYLTGASQASIDDDHTCVVKTDGTVWCWGYGYYGQLGNGGSANQSYPTQVRTSSTYLTDVSQVSVNLYFSCAIKTDNTVWCWGRNNGYQLGTGNTTDQYYAVQVKTNSSTYLTGANQISAGDGCTGVYPFNHTCVVKTDGTVWCWGYNTQGQVGNGNTSNQSYAVQVKTNSSTYLTGARQVSAGNTYTCAVKNDNSAYCWGYNFRGQLGTGSADSSSHPYAIQVSGGSNMASISAAKVIGIADNSSAQFGHTCAIKTDNTVSCWGFNSTGQLGNGNMTNNYTPSQISQESYGLMRLGYALPAASLRAGGGSTCGLGLGGSVYCWGYNVSGLGLAQNSTIVYPLQVPGVSGSGYLTDISQISGPGGLGGSYLNRGEHVCGIKSSDGSVYCWGDNQYVGSLGAGNTNSQNYPVQVKDIDGLGNLTGISQVATYGEGQDNGGYTCAVKSSDGSVYCWGDNSRGQLGNGTTSFSNPIPVRVIGVGGSGYLTGISQVTTGGDSVGQSHTCAVKSSDGSVYCWGYNYYGQLGNGTTTSTSTPVQVVGLTGVTQVSAGNQYTCAVKTDGTVWCWGQNDYCLLSRGSFDWTSHSTPLQVKANSSTYLTGVKQVSTGYLHVCVVKTDGTVWCWGDNTAGQLGLGVADSSGTCRCYPVQALGIGGSGYLTETSQITAGYKHTCAVVDDKAYCWGTGSYSVLGNGGASSYYPTGVTFCSQGSY